MPVIPNTLNTFWLFPDNVIIGQEYQFLDFKPEYKTSKGGKIPVFVLFGKIKGKNEGQEILAEVITAIWNIENLEEIKKTLGENTDIWNEVSFKVVEVSKDGKFKLSPIEKVT